MTTLNTIIEEEKPEDIEKWVRTLAGSSNPRDTDLLVAKINVLRTTAMQRAYEAGREEERDRILNILSNLVPKDEDAMDVINDWIIPELKRAIHSELDQPNK